MHSRSTTIVGLGLALALGLAACGSDDEPLAASETGSPAASAPGDQTPITGQAPVGDEGADGQDPSGNPPPVSNNRLAPNAPDPRANETGRDNEAEPGSAEGVEGAIEVYEAAARAIGEGNAVLACSLLTGAAKASLLQGTSQTCEQGLAVVASRLGPQERSDLVNTRVLKASLESGSSTAQIDWIDIRPIPNDGQHFATYVKRIGDRWYVDVDI